MKNDWMNDARKIPGDAMGYIRKLAVRAVIEGGYSPELVIDIFGLSRSVIYDWINKFKNGGYDALDTNYPPGMDPIITETMDEWLRDVVLSKNPTDYGYDTVLWTCDILAELLERVFKIKVTGATVNAHIKKMGLSYQKPNYRASEQNADEIEHFLNDKFPKIQQLAEKINAEIAFEDESGIELNAHSGYTWGDKGKTPEIIATGQRGKCNVLSIVTKDGKMQYLITQDNVNSEIYIEFLEQLLEGRTQPLILLVDRVSFHKSKKVRDFVRYNREKIRIFFLPKYAPEYNPTEQLWEDIKDNKLGRQPIKNMSDLRIRLVSELESLRKNTNRIISFFHLPETRYALSS